MSSPSTAALTRSPAPAGFDPQLRRLALVVVVGAIMTILDTTIVNVALTTLGTQLHTSLSTIQWVVTGYTLALSMTIPLIGWVLARFGARAVWIAALLAFAAGSALCGAAWSVASLIVFRVLQGAAAGLILPVGQTMLARAAGPERMGRVMAVIAVPGMLAPVLGPVFGGLIVGHLDWRWLFVVNLPIAAVAVALAIRLLPPDAPAERAGRIDALGLLLISPGLAALVYALSELGNGAGPASAQVLGWGLAGIALLTAFTVRGLVSTAPTLVDLRVFRIRSFSAAGAAGFLYSGGVFGLLVLLPLYYQLVQGTDALGAGLRTITWGLGAMATMPLAGRLTDSRGPRPVLLAGLVLVLVASLGLTRLAPDTSTVLLLGLLLVVGLGHGLLIPSLTGGMYRGLARADIPAATTLGNVALRLGSSFGVAAVAVVLQSAIRARIPGASGRLADAAAAAGSAPGRAELAAAFGHTVWWSVAALAVTLIPAALLGGRSREE